MGRHCHNYYTPMEAVKGKLNFWPLFLLWRLLEERRIMRFATVGGIGTVVKLSSLWLLVEMGGLHYLGAYPVAFVLTVTSNYLLNSLWTFRDREHGLNGYTKYVLLSSITLCINQGLLLLLSSQLGLWYMWSASFGILVAFSINFTVSRGWVWRKSQSISQ